MSLFNELKRRNVFKVSIAYIVMAWLVMQVADVILNNVVAPGWVFHVILLMLGIGLPFAIFFAWAFELTPEGLKRESEVDRSQSITNSTGRKLDYAIISVLIVALGYFAYDKFVLSASRDAALLEAASQAVTEPLATEPVATAEKDNSIAVLPFINMSSDEEQEYFSDGLSEELLNLLAKIPELQVAARTSSFSLKGKELQIAEIGKILKVAHVLEGSVRKAGKQVRITAQLIHVEDGFHMWSETYDRSLDNVFAIQDEIAAEVVSQLKLTLLGAVPTTTKTDPQAYAYFLRGRQLSREFTPESLEQGIALYEQALAIDPDYALAWIELSRNYVNQAGNDLIPQDEGLALARKATSKALAINPDLATGAAQNGWFAMMYDNDLTTAARHFEHALKLEPSNFDILRNVSSLALYLGRTEEAILLAEYLTARDPLNTTGHVTLGQAYFNAGRLDDALASFNFVLSLSPNRIGGQYNVGSVMLLKDKPEAALAAFVKEGDDEYRVHGSALALYSLDRETEHQAALAELQQRWGERWPSDVASVYAWAGDNDAAFDWLEKDLEITGNFNGIGTHPFMASLHDDPRWQPLMEKAGASAEQLDAIEFEFKVPE